MSLIANLMRHKGLLAAGLLGALGLFVLHGVLGAPDGHSYRHNMPWHAAFYSAFWAGDLYPRFLPDLWYGFGGHDFYFYGPMPFWIISLLGPLTCAGCEPGQTFAMGSVWLLLFSAITFFVLARRFVSIPIAAIGGAVYAILPYHYLIDWYVRQAIGEITAMIFLPLILLAALKLLEEKKGGILLSLSFAGLVFSHLPSALIVVHFLGAFVLWQTWSSGNTWPEIRETLIRFALWGGLGALISAIYWLPALLLLSDVSPAILQTSFGQPERWLVLDGQPEPDAVTGNIMKTLLFTGLVISAIGLWAVRTMPGFGRAIPIILVPAFFVLAMMSPLSWPIWKYWIIQIIQFPWRLLILLDLSVAFSIMLLAQRLTQAFEARRIIDVRAVGAAFGATIALIAAISVTVPEAIRAIDRSFSKSGDFMVAGAPEYIPPLTMDPVTLEFRKISHTFDTSEAWYEALFGLIERRAVEARQIAEQQTQSLDISPGINGRIDIAIEAYEARLLTLPIPYWKYWTAYDGTGTPVQISAHETLGVMQVVVPEGESALTLQLRQTRPEMIGSALSIMGVVLLLLSVLWGRFGMYFSRARRQSSQLSQA